MKRAKFLNLSLQTAIGMLFSQRLFAQISKGSVNTPLPSPLFPAQNVWNTSIKDLKADPQSREILLAQSCGNLKGFVRVECAMPYNVINTQTENIPFITVKAKDSGEDDPATNKFPYLPGMQFQNGPWANDGADHHLLVYDQATKYLYELYQLRQQADQSWLHEGAARFDLNTNNPRSLVFQDSADAAGLPILPGLIRMDEIRSGHIPHALRMTVGSTLEGYIFPATHCTRSFYADPPTLSPMGARFRLKCSIDPKNYDEVRKPIIECLQTYGAIVADNGTNFAITAVNDDDAFRQALPANQFYGPDHGDDASFRLLNNQGEDIHIDDFELVTMGPVTPLHH